MELISLTEITSLLNGLCSIDMSYLGLHKRTLAGLLTAPPPSVTQSQYDALVRLLRGLETIKAAKKAAFEAEKRMVDLSEATGIPFHYHSIVGVSNTYWPKTSVLDGLKDLGVPQDWSDFKEDEDFNADEDEDKSSENSPDAVFEALKALCFDDLFYGDDPYGQGYGWSRSFC